MRKEGNDIEFIKFSKANQAKSVFMFANLRNNLDLKVRKCYVTYPENV